MSVLNNALASLSTPEIEALLFRRAPAIEINIKTLRAFASLRAVATRRRSLRKTSSAQHTIPVYSQQTA
jgi:hypothetical protein